MIQRQDVKPGIPLSTVIDIPDRPHLSANIEHDSVDYTVDRYIPNTSFIEASNVFLAGLGRGGAISIVGPYGSGKSTFGLVLGQMVAPRHDPKWKTAYEMLHNMTPDLAANLMECRRQAKIHEHGMIKCVITARSEPVAATILRAAVSGAVSYFGTTYRNNDFAEARTLRRCAKLLQKGVVPDTATIYRIISSMAASAPVLLMIDEFGKNIEYFADNSSDGDLFLLQELAEMRGNMDVGHLHIVTIQHMAFGEYVAGSSDARIKEWAKIQGRFEMVYFSNSLEHTRTLLSSSLKPKSRVRQQILQWSIQHSQSTKEAGVDIPSEIAASCYPLHPLAVEALPELCLRYGQNDRTLLSFVFGRYPGTVVRFVDQERLDNGSILPTMGADHLYDYFITSSAPTRVGSLASTSRLVEIDTIIRDAQLSDETERIVLKTIGLLNLIGRSGRLRASGGIIRCMVGSGAAQAIKSLESKSIITYRRHADEYRVWHGTDVDIAAKIDSIGKTIRRMSYPNLMKKAMSPEPIIAARHGMETGTMRIFESLFEIPSDDIGMEYDGAIIYGTTDMATPKYEKPILVSKCKDVSGMVDAAAKVVTLRAVLNDDEVSSDWVAKGEVNERLGLAENALSTEFGRAYGADTEWVYSVNGKERRVCGTVSLAASAASDDVYTDTPHVRNEMINRNHLTTQGSAALNRLMHLMITNEGEERLGLDGWRPERAVYEAIISEYKVHICKEGEYRFLRPRGRLCSAWGTALSLMRNGKMTSLNEIYYIWRMPPYGIKDGVMPIFILLIILTIRDRVALYEHGTYAPRISASLAERLVKNPGHFSFKYHSRSRQHATLVQRTAESLNIDPKHGMLGIVKYLVNVVRVLPAYTSKTKNLDKKSLAVRNAIQGAVEPDTLLFESLPNALGMGPSNHNMDDIQIEMFALDLAGIIKGLQTAFDSMREEMRVLLFKETGMADRASLSDAASKILSDVSDQRMKVFLGAVAADIPDEQAWINYVGLTLTDVPPTDWSDENEKMFINGVRDVAAGFKRLMALKFGYISNSFDRSCVMVTITRPDGEEKVIILPVDDDRIARLTS
ncbi:MAG: hypothetical protein F4Y82_05215 [Cenarchaeum sp. SB0665_bin_23]|nr:hypothetical protein [Cenarchaeum sp. SB0665_bin_23]MYG32910.1 hypothetical protein [Cenarchaeum sp. SB0677_bin_16]